MMDKVLAEQNGQNVEVCLEEVVMKSNTEQDLIKDVEETLDKLQKVTVKIDLSKCTFGMEEGKFLGYVVTNISRFIPKLVELMLPIRNIQRSLDVIETSEWIREAEEAFQKIKIRLGKLQTLAIPKESEALMICGGSRILRTKEAKMYKEEIMDATTLFHRFLITYLPKGLNPKAEALIRLTSIKLEFLNQEVSVGVKTRPSVEAQDKPSKARNVLKEAMSRKSSPI
ncbi:hypothetical protein Tco_0617670 [Tanacetum coccineum]